ncbi:MAG: hypothetical protein ABFR89_04610 [Actinomycetota bacterium]
MQRRRAEHASVELPTDLKEWAPTVVVFDPSSVLADAWSRALTGAGLEATTRQPLGERADVAVVGLADPDAMEVALRKLDAAASQKHVFMVESVLRPGSHVLVKAGASALLDRASSPHRLIAAVRAVSAGDVVLPPWLAPVFMDLLPSRAEAAFNPEDLAILAMLSTGEDVSSIAERIGYGRTTLHRHLRNDLYRRLDVRDRDQAVARAAAWGLIDSSFEAVQRNGHEKQLPWIRHT